MSDELAAAQQVAREAWARALEAKQAATDAAVRAYHLVAQAQNTRRGSMAYAAAQAAISARGLAQQAARIALAEREAYMEAQKAVDLLQIATETR